MRTYAQRLPQAADEPARLRAALATGRRSARLLPYLWRYSWRVGLALAFMVARQGGQRRRAAAAEDAGRRADAVKPARRIGGDGAGGAGGAGGAAARLRRCCGCRPRSSPSCANWCSPRPPRAPRAASRWQVFRHLHALSLRFHLERQTGGMTRDIERGTRGVQSLISYSLYSIVPTLIEVGAGADAAGGEVRRLVRLDHARRRWSSTSPSPCRVTEWRTQFRKKMNELDSTAHSRAIDSLLNYETVKYFNNEEFEAERYDESLERLRRAALKSQTTLSMLNTGQQLIIASALVAMLWRATQGVVDGRMTLGDLVMVNAFMIQLYIPLNFLGVIYREIKQSLTDLDKMFAPAGARARGGRRPRRRCRWQVTRGERALRARELRLRPRPADPARRELRDPAGQDGGGGRALGRRQVDAGAAALPLLRRAARAASPSTARTSAQVTQASVRQADRHRAAGHGAVQRHRRLQHRLRPPRRQPGRGRGGGAGGAHPRLHRLDAEGLRDDGRRARPEALRRREAARGDRAHAAEEPADPDLRRGHLGARLGQRARHPGRAASARRATRPRW